ncbi:MAG: hypothetical protein KGZ59_12465 [Chitinophagaceae bacterium]|nr:hypothetical protein [Chitinophagaceae bacterium]
MNYHEQYKYLDDIVQGNVIEGRKDITTTVRNYLSKSFKASNVAERKFEYFQQIKKEQANIIKELSTTNNWWFNAFENFQYLTEGGEAKVYLSNLGTKVLKINDAIYYNTWLDFFNSILLHNYYFTNTHYNLLGFVETNNILYAALEQAYVNANKLTDFENVKTYLNTNEFLHKKRYDFINKKYGITLEDVHDENVLTFNDTLFFIDTFFSL